MIVDPSQVPGGFRVSCDVAIVGTGAGGGAASALLAESGAKVVLLEAGRRFLPAELRPRASWAYPNLYQARGLRVAKGNAYIPVMTAEVVGGGTFVNSAICFRPPAPVLSSWVRDFSLDFADPRAMAPIFAEVEADIGVRKTEPAQARGNNLTFKRGVDALGWTNGDFISRNAPGCVGCGVCQFGCPIGGKGSVDRNYLSRAARRGAAIYTQARVDRVLTATGRATGVTGTINGQPFEVRADHVMLCAGAFGTPLLLMRSGLGGASGQLGRNLHLHPCIGTVAFMPEQVRIWDGVTQGYAVEDTDRGLVFETFSATPEVFFAGLPRASISTKLMPYLAAAGAVIRDESSGWITPAGDDADVRYHLGDADRRRGIEALRRLAEVFFAAGAKYVSTGLPGLPLQTTLDGLRTYLTDDVPAESLTLQSAHAQGTARMSADPARGVVDTRGRVYGVGNLWVADSTLFPSAVGVNPQITIMAFAKVIARELLRA